MTDRSNVFSVLLVSQDGFQEDRLADVARISTGYDFANPQKKDGKKDEVLLKFQEIFNGSFVNGPTLRRRPKKNRS